ncbi:uncharacterized protein BJX67DRAFT_383009 [Aspergillus lucknowensis]|uniref:Uncharacterized protein n=1 Tax=Aspergillus lucknowensis TaxID=176173 RepID=A0ABR4LL38_9EURO
MPHAGGCVALRLQKFPLGWRFFLCVVRKTPPERTKRPSLEYHSFSQPQFSMLITRGISLVNFAVASSALAFQVFVLYPWHNQLDEEFKALKTEHLRVLRQLNLPSAPFKKNDASSGPNPNPRQGQA